MQRLHIVGGKNHGKTTLIVELVQELTRRGLSVGTVKHTHHDHELDVPGKDSYRHRVSGASAVAILSPSMYAVFLPTDMDADLDEDPYELLHPMFARCDLVLVEGDSRTSAPKLEVWRSEVGTPPLAAGDLTIEVIVTDDAPLVAASLLPRSQVCQLVDWLCEGFLDSSRRA